MDLMYLSPQRAEERLEGDSMNIPDRLEFMLEDIHTAINTWLSWEPILHLYDKEPPVTMRSQGKIYINPKHFPVTQVVDVKRKKYSSVQKNTPEAIAAREADPKGLLDDANWEVVESWEWDRRSAIYVYDYLGCGEGSQYKVRYFAGYDPLPPIFERVTYDILKQTIQNRGSMDWLYKPTSDATSLSIPGSLSESRKLSETGEKNQRDRLFQDLKKYKRSMLLSGTGI